MSVQSIHRFFPLKPLSVWISAVCYYGLNTGLCCYPHWLYATLLQCVAAFTFLLSKQFFLVLFAFSLELIQLKGALKQKLKNLGIVVGLHWQQSICYFFPASVIIIIYPDHTNSDMHIVQEWTLFYGVIFWKISYKASVGRSGGTAAPTCFHIYILRCVKYWTILEFQYLLCNTDT